MANVSRKPVPFDIQVQVFFKDRWLCYICRRPLIFPPALKQLADLVGRDAPSRALAYYNTNWRRDSAPLLDELGASVDHVEAFAKGGAHAIENFRAICSRCNARKNTADLDAYLAANKPWRVRGKHGEPEVWDGLSSVFVGLARQRLSVLTPTERRWLAALETHFSFMDSVQP